MCVLPVTVNLKLYNEQSTLEKRFIAIEPHIEFGLGVKDDVFWLKENRHSTEQQQQQQQWHEKT